MNEEQLKKDKELKEIPGFNGYFISKNGDLFSQWNTNGSKIKVALWKMKIHCEPGGYYKTTLRHNLGYKKTLLLHRAVLMAWHSQPPNEKSVCRHLNGIKTDNRLENLRWGTSQDNEKDKILHGTVLWGERSYLAKLNPAKVKLAIHLRKLGWSCLKIGKLWGLNKNTISMATTGKTWKYLLSPNPEQDGK